MEMVERGRKISPNIQKYVGIVDDELDIVMLFKDALSGFRGIDVFGFTDPRLALEHFTINHSQYEAVISDFRMPEMNGIELLKKVKEINSNVKTLLISAFEINDELFRECSCVDKLLQKPIHISKLINEVGMQVILSSGKDSLDAWGSLERKN